MNSVTWVGPFQLDALLRHVDDERWPRPPDRSSVYLISRGCWEQQPDLSCTPLYVGGTTGRTDRFRTRVGELLYHLFGFFVDGKHSGGESLHSYCVENRVDPLTLYLAWAKTPSCPRCLERAEYERLHPVLNKVAPPRCKKHGGS